MSRSYKHTPVTKMSTGKAGKRTANRTVRRKLKDIYYEVANNMGYKLITNSWDIIDYRSYGNPKDWDNSIEYNKCYLWK